MFRHQQGNPQLFRPLPRISLNLSSDSLGNNCGQFLLEYVKFFFRSDVLRDVSKKYRLKNTVAYISENKKRGSGARVCPGFVSVV